MPKQIPKVAYKVKLQYQCCAASKSTTCAELLAMESQTLLTLSTPNFPTIPF